MRNSLLNLGRLVRISLGTCAVVWLNLSSAALREENFDHEPITWEGINNRSTAFSPKTVIQDFGYSPLTHHAGTRAGEVGGQINPAAEAAYYAYPLPQRLNLDSSITDKGKIYVAPGAGHCLLGFFNTNTLDGWRTPNTLVLRINGRGNGFHCHLEYCTSRWRAEAGVVGEIVRGERIQAKEIPCASAYEWKLVYDPKGAQGRGVATFTINGNTAVCEVLPEHRREGATFTHFGLLPVMKAWDSPGQMWIDDITVNGVAFDFSADPKWEGLHNRTTYVTSNTRPRFDFGWSPSQHAGGKKAGELGGLIFRGDCREPARMACYGDRIEMLSLNTPLTARGKLSVLRAVSDSTASIGFYHSAWSMRTNASQQHSIPMDFLGINIEGPSSEGFFFYPVYRVHGDAAKMLNLRGAKALHIYPDGKVHNWFLSFDPEGANGQGRITVGLDENTCTLDLDPGHKQTGASFNRFGICTPWIDGNSVTAYFDDLTYTCSAP